MKKEELLNILNTVNYYSESAEAQLLKKLIVGTPEEEPDFKEALRTDFALDIINLFLECYSSADLLDWLSKHNFDPFIDFRYADIVEVEEIDPEELEAEQENALFYNEKYICRSW